MYQTAAIDSALPFIELPDAVNLGKAELAETYAKAVYTNKAGQTFRGTPINFTVTILKDAQNQVAAIKLVEYLLSIAGQELVCAYHFLPWPRLVGGSPTAVPVELQKYIQGEYFVG